jgi:hypothetical protein
MQTPQRGNAIELPGIVIKSGKPIRFDKRSQRNAVLFNAFWSKERYYRHELTAKGACMHHWTSLIH